MMMTPRQRLLTALRGGIPDRVPCYPSIIRWVRYHAGSPCPRHQLQLAEQFGLDLIVLYGQYVWQSVSNDYVYAPGGNGAGTALGLYGDLPDVNVDLRIQNMSDHVRTHRTFRTPSGILQDVIQWARPNVGYGDGPNPHRVEPLVKDRADLDALRHLYPPPRRDLLADIPLLLREAGDGALVAATDATGPGAWGMETLGPEGMLCASVTDPDLLRGVCRLAADAHLRNLRAMLEQGLEAVFDSWFQCGPSVGWSPQTYATVFLPLVREAVRLTHEFEALYIYQDDGRQQELIPHLVDAGVDAISGLQPPPVGDAMLADIKQQFGDRVALVGGLDPCYTFDRGSPAAVRQAVAQAVAAAADGGGFVLGTAEAVAPETPAACLHAMAAAAAEFGTYTEGIGS